MDVHFYHRFDESQKQEAKNKTPTTQLVNIKVGVRNRTGILISGCPCF